LWHNGAITEIYAHAARVFVTFIVACCDALEATPPVIRADLNLVGLAMRGERKVIDKIVDGLKFHS
jgi:hypothetical protein